MSRVLIITPASRSSRTGNRTTADRWVHILRSLGHRVRVAMELGDRPYDLLVVLHARKGAAAVADATRRWPEKPVVLALTGTDLYHDIRQSRSAQTALQQASRLILLQAHGQAYLAPHLRRKSRVIYQSATPPTGRVAPLQRVFEVCVSAHLRAVKDPLRAARAARRLPHDSRIRVTHIGAALSDAWQRRAEQEMLHNPRYRWRGEVSRGMARRLLARSRLMVIASKLEGGANVVSEALATGVPVLASRVSGNLGMLGEDYPGYFQVGNSRELAGLLYRCETEPEFYRTLILQCRALSARFTPDREMLAWGDLLAELT